MENYDDDFSTLKAPPTHLLRSSQSLQKWKSDIPLGDGDVTLRGSRKLDSLADSFDDDDDDDFASEFETAVRNRKTSQRPPENLPEAFLSDSSSRSTGRTSISSAASASSLSSAPTSWDQDDDIGLDLDDFDAKDPKQELLARFNLRQQRAQAEAAAEAAKLTQAAKLSKKKLRYADELDESDMDETLGLDLEQLTLRVKTGTANKHVRLQAPQVPHAQSKMLRGMRSIAQLPNQRSERVDSPLRPKAAQSMLDLGRFTVPARQRPLTAYKEPSKKPSRVDFGRQKLKQPNLIQNPSQVLTRQVRNGMVLDPNTGMWEGNDVDAMRFEAPSETVKPTLISKRGLDTQQVPTNGMVFDSRTLLWVHANEEEYDDPFDGIDEPLATGSDNHLIPSRRTDLMTLKHKANAPRKFTNDSIASTTSAGSTAQFGRSITRAESSDREVFEVSRLASEWRHADERFMRKFGKWIGGEEERTDAMLSDQQFYEMVRNT